MEFKAQKFGVELEFGGITRKEAAEAIGTVINGTPYYEYCYDFYRTCKVVGPDGREWKVMSDGSIHGMRGEACEFVTPVLSYEDIPQMQECIRALRRAGAQINSSCGLHIHVDAGNHTAKSLKNLAFTFRAKEDLIFRAIGTRESRLGQWCRPIDDRLIDNIKKIKKLDMTALNETWYETYRDYSRSTEGHYHRSRYHALNYHSVWYRGTVEFRCFEATLHAGEIRAYINLVLAMSAAAINAKRASAEVLDNGNDKYAMRCWLLRLGFIGEEYATIRKHLLKRLSGNAAWRNAPETYDSYNRQRAM